jgi:hypothetical protein
MANKGETGLSLQAQNQRMDKETAQRLNIEKG